MKRLLKPLLFLAGVAVVQVVIRVLGVALKERFLSQQLGEGEVNAVGVRGKAEEKVTSTNFRGGYLRAMMGVVELDLTEAIIEDPPATIEMTVVMGGAGITVPEGWKVRVDTGSILGGVQSDSVGGSRVSGGRLAGWTLELITLASAEAGRARLLLDGVSDQAEPPDLVLTGKIIMGGAAIIYKKTDSVSEAV